MERDVRLRIKRCKICQASKHGRFPGEAGRQAICWQTVATRSCRPGRTHARREHLDLSINRPLYAVGRRSNYSGRVCPYDGQGARSERFCYFSLPEQLHSDQRAQFQSQLLSDLCRLWGVNKSWTTPYHPQGNGVVEHNNRMLGDSLRSLFLGRGQGGVSTSDTAYRSTPHTSTSETPNLLMLGRETRVPDHLTYHIPEQKYSIHEYASKLVEKMQVAHEILREKHWQVR